MVLLLLIIISIINYYCFCYYIIITYYSGFIITYYYHKTVVIMGSLLPIIDWGNLGMIPLSTIKRLSQLVLIVARSMSTSRRQMNFYPAHLTPTHHSFVEMNGFFFHAMVDSPPEE